MRKRLTAWLVTILAVAMIVTALPLSVWADTEGDGQTLPAPAVQEGDPEGSGDLEEPADTKGSEDSGEPGDTKGPEDPEESEEPGDPIIADSYMQVSFLDLLEGKKVSLSEDMATTKPEKMGDSGLLFAGPISEFNTGRVTITEPFVFDADHNPVGRISLDALADRNIFATVKIYLDDSEEPVVEFEIDNRSKKDGWNTGGCYTADVYKKIQSGEHTVSIGFEVSGKSGVQQASVLLRSIEFAENPGIPVMYFNIDEEQGSIEAMNSDENHETECHGSVDIQVPDGYKSEYQKNPSTSADYQGLELDYIRGRGNSTWSVDKKPYKVKLHSGKNLFGMGKNKHWVLLANRYDNSLLRNRMTYWLGPQLGLNYTPECVPVDVVMNGEYYGSYLLCEQIRIGEARVAIDELTDADADKEEPNITGGYLMSMSPYGDEDPGGMFTTRQGMELYNEEPNFPENSEEGKFDGNDEQKAWIRSYVQKTEDAIFGKDFKDNDGHPYTDYLDFDAAVNYWWVQQFSLNGDAYGSGSTYLYKERDKTDEETGEVVAPGKLFWGPLWDFDYVAWGDLQDIDNLMIEGFDAPSCPWFNRMLADPAFTKALVNRWPLLMSLMNEITKDGGILDQYYEQTLISERYDHEKWGFFEDGLMDDGYDHDSKPVDDNTTYRDQINQLKAWIDQRTAWVEKNQGQLNNLTATITFMVDDEEYTRVTVLKDWDYFEIPEGPEKDGFIFTGWYTEDGEKMPESVEEDLVVFAGYVDEESATKAEEICFDKENVWISIKNINQEEVDFEPNYTLLPRDAQDLRIDWHSSDEEVASVNEDGQIKCHKLGSTTITATLRSGEKGSYRLTVYDPEENPPVNIQELKVDMDEATIKVGESIRIPVTILPEDKPLTDGDIVYSADDNEIADVDMCGVVTGLTPGETVIHVGYNDGSDICEDIDIPVRLIVEDEEGEYENLDDADQAIFMLLQIDNMIRPAEYTANSYAAYRTAYVNAMRRLRNERLSKDEISKLRHEVIEARLDLEKKAANTIKVKAKKTIKIKASKLRKKARTIKRKKAFTVSKANGKLTYKLVSVSKKKYKKYFKVNSKTGNIRIKKGLRKKGVYKVKVKVTAVGDGDHKAGSRTVTVKIRVK